MWISSRSRTIRSARSGGGWTKERRRSIAWQVRPNHRTGRSPRNAMRNSEMHSTRNAITSAMPLVGSTLRSPIGINAINGNSARPAINATMPVNARETIALVKSMPCRCSIRIWMTDPTADPAGRVLLAAFPVSCGAATSAHPSTRSTRRCIVHIETNVIASQTTATTTSARFASRTERSAAGTSTGRPTVGSSPSCPGEDLGP